MNIVVEPDPRPLSREEILEMWFQACARCTGTTHDLIEDFARRVEQAHGQEPVQEPVAWRVQRSDGQYELYFLKAAAERAAECYIKRPPVEPLYTAPPQRKPLTDEEIYAAIKNVDSLRAVEVARAIERAHGITQSS